MKDSRRRAIIASAVVVVLIGIAGLLLGYNPEWNHGRDPTKDHPNPKINREFDPKYTMLLYMDWEDSFGTSQDILRVRAIKVQFRSTGWGNHNNNTWETNQQKIAYWINYLNAGNTPTQTHDQVYVTPGLEDFKFNQPHHVVIYIQNKNLGYNLTYPVWFSDVLVNSPSPAEDAAENWSFFGAKVLIPRDANNNPAIVGDYSKQVIYMKNFFRVKSLFGHPKIIKPQSYSLKINALANVTDLSGSPANTSGQPWANILPFIIDPDTGNMGGGDPPKD